MVVFLLACNYLDGEVRALEEAVPEVGWYPVDDALARVIHPPSAQRLRDAIEPSGGVVYRSYQLHPYEPLGDVSLG